MQILRSVQNNEVQIVWESSMRLKLAAIITVFCIAAGLSAAQATSSGNAPARNIKAQTTERARLHNAVTVHSATLTLADLLPASASPALAKEASLVPLGAAPQPPNARVIYRQQLQFLLEDRKDLLAEISIPEEIKVQRFYRVISKQEVSSAIEQALSAKGGAAGASGLDLTDLVFSAPVYATSDDPGLQVIRIESDPARHETRFRLWTSKQPHNLPFTAIVPGAAKLPVLVAAHGLAPGEIVSAKDFTVEMRPGIGLPAKPLATAAGLSGLESQAVVRPGQPVVRDDFGRPVLVQPETLATLIVQGKGFQIKTQVTPLEQGVLNQEIRVRNTESRQVVEARVIGRDALLKTQ